jgi:NADPH-ferrihemoprotein reductase
MSNSESLPDSVMYAAGAATVVLGSCLAYVMTKSKNNDVNEQEVEVEEIQELDKTKYPGGYITIYYGSQTGTAETFAQDLEREGEDNGFKIEVVDLEEIEEDILGKLTNEQKRDDRGKNRALFMMATYGEGEPTDNAVAFIQFLKDSSTRGNNDNNNDESESNDHDDSEEKKGEESVHDDDNNVGSNLLENLEYAVFGLGNRQYEHYNATGITVDTLLEKSGASRFVKIGLGDDDNDLEGDFETWKDDVLWPALKRKYNKLGSSLSEGTVTGTSSEKLPECHYAIEYLDNGHSSSNADTSSHENIPLSSKSYFTATDCSVSLKRELRAPADGGSTLHVEIDATELKYQTADNLAILPVNEDSAVERVAKALNYDLAANFKLLPAKGHESKFTTLFPTPCTVHECLARYCDLVGPPRRSDLKLIAAYAKDATDKKALLRMASKEGKSEYKEKIVNAKIGIVDIISKLCTSVSMPLEHFVSICPRLQPRYYTISSSSSVHPDSIHATVSIMSEQREDGSTFKGVCTNYLAGLMSNGKVRAFVRDSTFRLPSDVSTPIIMIGPGTGIAPMRALLQERSHQQNVQKLNVGSNILYFGCKNREHDFIYADELNKYEKDGILTEMHLAFSREQDDKVYVQHLLAKNAKETWDLINEQGAYVYVCGGVRMGQDVSETLRKLVAEHGNYSTSDAKNYIEKLTSNGRLVQELWA